MVTMTAVRWITPEEYLECERAAETKSEYFNGQIFAMAGASRAHTKIVSNVIIGLGLQLKGRPCDVYPQDMRVKVSDTGLYTYPDVVIVCGQSIVEDSNDDIIMNPTILIEVLSKSTEAYDRGDKFAHYRRLESLKEYVLVAQDRARIERFVRQNDQWVLTEFSSMEESVELSSINCSLAMSEVYDRVEFPTQPEADRQKPM